MKNFELMLFKNVYYLNHKINNSILIIYYLDK